MDGHWSHVWEWSRHAEPVPLHVVPSLLLHVLNKHLGHTHLLPLQPIHPWIRLNLEATLQAIRTLIPVGLDDECGHLRRPTLIQDVHGFFETFTASHFISTQCSIPFARATSAATYAYARHEVPGDLHLCPFDNEIRFHL